jgi:hypothetical protein
LTARREEIVLVKRIMLFLVAMLAMVAILALPAIAEHNAPYYDEYDRCDTDHDGRYDDDQCYKGGPRDTGYEDDHYGRYDDDDDDYDRWDCDWYGPYGRGDHEWEEYWCWHPHEGWEYVTWRWA